MLPASSRSALYILFSWHNGATLAQLLDSGRHFSISDAVRTGMRLLKGLSALHRLNILHRDIKPENLHLDTEGKLRILDLGVAACGSAGLENRAGTPSYMAPELFSGAEASAASDLYSVGVTLYHLLTRKYPYGEIEPFQTPPFHRAGPALRATAPTSRPGWTRCCSRLAARTPCGAMRRRRNFSWRCSAANRPRRATGVRPWLNGIRCDSGRQFHCALFVLNLLLIYLLLVS